MLGGKIGTSLNISAAAPGSSSSTAGRVTKSPEPAAPGGAGQPANKKKNTDPNMTDGRLVINRRCIYERQLPGDAYVTAHAERLQHGYFDSKNTSDPEIPHVDFFAVNFVLHPGESDKHRFKAATIKATIQNVPMGDAAENPYPYPQENPKFLMHAPHLIYGAVSPETLQWTFSLAGSLGVSDSPVAASVTPSGSRSASYKLYEMMKIQGSCRTLRSPDGAEFDVEDGEIVWSLSENGLQRSGLPREFTFVMLVQKPSADSRILFKLKIDPVIDAWYGSYPSWWLSRPNYQPLSKRAVNFRAEIGQHFSPVDSEKGFNFANLAGSLDDYVNMPGSTYSSNVSPDGVYNDPTGTGSGVTNPSQPLRPIGGGNNSQPIYIPEYPQYPSSQQPSYYPPIPNIGRAWETNNPFQQGWPRGDPYYSGPNNNSQHPESTINIRVLLDNNFTSQMAAASLGAPLRHASPFLKAPSTHNASLGSNGTNGSSSGRTRSLRRTRSSERLNRLSSSPFSFVDTEALKDEHYQQAQPSDVNHISNTPNSVVSPREVNEMYEINNTPPPDSIRDPIIVNGHASTTPTTSPETLGYKNPMNGVSKSTLSNGTQNTRAVSGSGHISRRASSQNQNGYNNRYSYPLPSTDY